MTQHITQEQAFEQWYVENAFNLEVNPIWPRDYGLQRKAWRAAIQWDRDQRAKELPVLPEPVAWLANYGGNVYTEAQLKQAVRDALDTQDVEDAERYRWLREQHWSTDTIAVVLNPKQAVKLGYVCPSDSLLDETIDAAIAKGAK